MPVGHGVARRHRSRAFAFEISNSDEPLCLQGWQIVDEVNRVLAGEAPSGFIPSPELVTVDNVPAGDVFDPDSGYRDVYLANWGVA